MNLTFPRHERTGKEKSANELAMPDERNASYVGIEAEDIQAAYLQAEKSLGTNIPEELQDRISLSRKIGSYAWFCWELYTVSLHWSLSGIEMALRIKYAQKYPDKVSLRAPAGQAKPKKKTIDINDLNDHLESGWWFEGQADSSVNFHDLLAWAFREQLLPSNLQIPLDLIKNQFDSYFNYEYLPTIAVREGWINSNGTREDLMHAWHQLTPEEQRKYQFDSATILTRELPTLRNLLSHPSRLNRLQIGPSQAIGGFHLLIGIVSHLW